jgi:hypothetical protein
MKKLLVLSIFVLLGIKLCFAQETPKPEFFGIYAVVNGQLKEFNKKDAAKLSGAGDMINTTLGIRELNGPWFVDSTIHFITYGINKRPILTKLTWEETVQSKNVVTGATANVEAKMYVANGNIEFRIAPIQEMEDCYKFLPSETLKEGYYCLHFGRLTSQDAFDMTVESNTQNDVFDFAVTKGLKIEGDLSSCNIDKGEYTLPESYGLHFIEDGNYIKIPISRGGVKNIPEFGPIDNRRRGVVNVTDVTLNASKLEKVFISFSEKNPRMGVRISISAADYKDMVPEKMFLSKLKQVEVDTRKEREIKKNKPEEMEKVWIEEVEIPYETVISGFIYPRIASLHLENNLEPGVYAFHNGLLKGLPPTFGVDNIIYSFRVK